MKTPYQEKLTDPRWQKRRLQCFDEAEWKCVACGESEMELHAHHTRYVEGYEPWDYNSYGDIVCLCSDCHKMAHIDLRKIARYVAYKASVHG